MVEKKKSSFNISSLRRIFTYAAPYKTKFYGSISLAILLAVITPIRPMLVQTTIDKYITQSLPKMVVYITLIQIALLLLESGIRFLFSYTSAWLGQTVVKDLRNQVYKKVLNFKLNQFDKTPIGTLTTRTINDIESINEVFSDGFIPIVADLLSIICVLTYMFWVDWSLTLVALIPFPIMIIATYYFKESINKSFFRVRNAVAALNAFVQERLSGMSVVQTFAVQNQEFKKFTNINAEHRNANIKAIYAYSVFFPVIEIILALSMGIVIWYTAGDAIDMHENKQGIIVSFILCLNLLFRPLRMIADKFNTVQMGVIASERVFTVLDNNDKEDNDFEEKHDVYPIKGNVTFKDVWFAYQDENWVIKNLSFNIHNGETIAIVGHTGSGKSTIISLLSKFYEYQKGAILLDGKEIKNLSNYEVRSQIGVVLQDVFLFSGSIFENITLRDPSIQLETVRAAARMIDMDDFIMSLPGSYEFNVKERGGTLSVGQRQLISFIRALLYNPSILILDEASSSIDTESERLLQNATEKLVENRTSIIIAHRLSTIKKADKILVLDKGVMVEWGSHQELMALNGYYAELYEMQFRKNEKLSTL
ncbi:MAG: ABC transporter ATP-binding protein [Chitinophagaceae bacterium]|nr:MAG: ABC transporter ATP-binding protein [Chitinophagaceae bacterium]